MSWATDGQDGNKLHFENIGPFFLVYRLCLETLVKALIMVYFSFTNSLDVSLLVFYKHFA